ncbi:MAG: DUF4874 domain-containing protein [Verrucomicrobiota bacterium]|nr:DUF4874 domain-containing protein [Verrucomicrobiota bacterium]
MISNTIWLDTAPAIGRTVVENIYKLNEFTNSAISSSYLDSLQTDFDLMRSRGQKLAPTSTYDWISPVTNDVPAATVIGHLEQLATILNSNKDVMSFLNLGFIGRYGEMHTSSSGHTTPGDVTFTASGLQIVDKVMEIMAVDRMWAVRYPDQLSQLYTTPLDSSLAYTTNIQARLGFSNDGLMHDETHLGTFTSPSGEPIR